MDNEIVGRVAERARLDAFVDSIVKRPGAMLLEGEPGIGKTTIFDQVVTTARERLPCVLVARAALAETKLAYGAVMDLLGDVIDKILPELPEPQALALDVALLRAAAPEQAPDPHAVSVAFLGALRALATNGPVLLAIDDIQWLDASSSAALAFALRRVKEERIGLLAAARVATDATSVPRAIAVFPRELVERIRLGPLSLAELHHVLDRRIGVSLPRSLLLRVHEASGGNPLFAIELADALSRAGGTLHPGQPLPVPETLGELLTQRVRRLDPLARQASLMAAIVAQPTVDLLVAALGGTEEARDAVERAIDARVLRLDGERAWFMHPLLSASVHDQATPEERRSAHGHAAHVIVDPERRARHLALATTAPNAVVAAALDKAATAARNRGAPAEAASLLELAHDLTPGHERTAGLKRTIESARLHYESGDPERAMALLTGAGSTANPGIERAEVLGRLGAVHSFAVSWRSASELFSQALDEAPIDAPLRADLEVDLAIALMVTGDIPAALAHARTGLELAETSANASLLAVALSTLGFMSFALGEGLPVDLFARALEYEDEEPRVWIPFGPRLIAAAALKYSDRFDAARDLLAQELLGRREVGDEARISFLLYHLAELECWTGHMDLAANLAEQSDEAAILTGQFAHRAASLYARALVAAYRGRLDEAAIGARDSLELALRAANVPVAQQATAVLGFVELSRGNPAGADAFLGPLINAVIAFGLGEPGILRFLPDEVEALIALGDLDRARAALDPFEARAEAMERRSAQATSARCRGLLHAAEGNFEKALRACEAAVARHADLPLPFELGRTLLVTGHIERRAGRRKAARGSLERACAIFEELGASSWADTARRELSSIGGRQPAGSGLTASERRVAELVAEGLTNREVASALSLTERTIESHLSRVYAKLGVRSRSELAHRLTARLGSER